MVIIELRFLAGKYHATAWGRNVNEGEVEWPPSPFRLTRALADCWFRKCSDISEERFLKVARLLSTPVKYMLPEITTSHLRSYQPVGKKQIPDKRQRLLDAFVVISPDTPIYIGIDYTPSKQVIEDLQKLLSNLSYLGRAESWLEARLVSLGHSPIWNCLPGASSEPGMTTARVAGLRSEEEYLTLSSLPKVKVGKGKKRNCTWREAFCLSTTDLQAAGWSDHPVISWDRYIFTEETDNAINNKRKGISLECCSVMYALNAPVLPHIKDTILIAERTKSILMGIHRKIMDDDPARVSSNFSGKDKDGHPLKGHKHAFYWPLDLDRDGKLDHILIHSSTPFYSKEIKALDKLNRIWQSKSREDISLILVDLANEPPKKTAKRWRSKTPFVTLRHYKKRFGSFEEWLRNEVSRECTTHRLPQPKKIEFVDRSLSSHVRWPEFRRSRKNNPPLVGNGFVLTFDENVIGEFSLGSYCHYGLGLFEPLEN